MTEGNKYRHEKRIQAQREYEAMIKNTDRKARERFMRPPFGGKIQQREESIVEYIDRKIQEAKKRERKDGRGAEADSPSEK